MNQTAAPNIHSLPTGTNQSVATAQSALEQILLGKQEQVTLALSCLIARGHLLIEDVPGVGKTTLAQALGAVLGMPWTRVQFTSDLLPADIVGASIFNTTTQNFEFKPGPVFTSILLADEINRAPPKAQSALLEFFVIATQNPADQLGAFPLPESQLDRFLVGIEIGYPDKKIERELLEQGDRRTSLSELSAITDPDQVKTWSKAAEQVHIAPPIFDYIQALLSITREGAVHHGTGLSPRAGLNLVRLVRAYAFLAGRNHVLPDDVRAVFPAMSGHRLTGRVSSGHALAEDILDQVPMP